ncbi:hypothetical protein ACH5RR_037368 [Cinchona calisaya]|uniref:Uncharacterized protein n=1 Tax=Cinchona calisaya TaxID=153742 RepID=A0ABD2Y5Z1_9GENT
MAVRLLRMKEGVETKPTQLMDHDLELWRESYGVLATGLSRAYGQPCVLTYKLVLGHSLRLEASILAFGPFAKHATTEQCRVSGRERLVL